MVAEALMPSPDLQVVAMSETPPSMLAAAPAAPVPLPSLLSPPPQVGAPAADAADSNSNSNSNINDNSTGGKKQQQQQQQQQQQGGGGGNGGARRAAAGEAIGAVWSAATRGQYVEFLQAKKKLSKASVHSYCWRLETLFKALVQLPPAPGPAGPTGGELLDSVQLRALIEGHFEEAERLVAQDDRRSHWRLLKDWLGLERPEEPAHLSAAAAPPPPGIVDGSYGEANGDGGHLLANGNGGSTAGLLPSAIKLDGSGKWAGAGGKGRQAAAAAAGQGKVWDMELKRDYRAWLRERGVKNRTCGSYCTFVHNLLRALADARKPLVPLVPQQQQQQQQPPEPSIVEASSSGGGGGAPHPYNGTNGVAAPGVSGGGGPHEAVAGAAAAAPPQPPPPPPSSPSAAAAAVVVVEPRREGLNRAELIELLEEQQEEAQRIVRQSKKNRYLLSFREFLGMFNPPEEKAKRKQAQAQKQKQKQKQPRASIKAKGTGRAEGAVAAAPYGRGKKRAGPSSDWTERIGSGYKRWVGAGRAGSGAQARKGGYVGAARSVLRELRRRGWVVQREGPLPPVGVSGVSGVGKAEVLAAIEAHEADLRGACGEAADEERLGALLGYLRAGRVGVNGDGGYLSSSSSSSTGGSSMDFGLEDEGDGDDDEEEGSWEEEEAAAEAEKEEEGGEGAAAVSATNGGGGGAGNGKRKRPAVTSREKRLIKRCVPAMWDHVRMCRW
jgi:hypothetical protein